MRSALCVALVSCTALAANRPIVTALFPPSSSDASLQQLALLIEARASELIEETGKASELHLKQVVRAIDEEGFTGDLNDAANVEALRQAVGADRALAFSLEVEGDAFLLSGVVVDGKKPVPLSVRLPKTWSGAIAQGSVALAKGLLGSLAVPGKTSAQPSSTNEEALRALGACYPVVLRQPLSAETPTLLDTAELERAAASCQRAAELDPSLRFALATGALAQAILGGDAAAAKSLERLGDTDDMLEAFTLARFWLLTRYQSNEAGVAYLTSVLKKHPGELLARAYLGDTQFALGAWADAEKTWKDYIALAPNSAWAWGRLSKAMARQGRVDDALAAAKKGFALSPTSPEARLELGSRFLDAGKPKDAKPILEPLARMGVVKGEHVLRLGWAHWLDGELDAAQAYFQRALDVSNTPGEWRTRGRAAYDLALVEAKRGHTELARAALQMSLASGLKPRQLDPSLTELARDLERSDVAKPKAPPDKRLVPKEASLFPVDAFGDPDVKAKKPPPPEGLVLFRF